jgi:hypothetical protein
MEDSLEALDRILDPNPGRRPKPPLGPPAARAEPPAAGPLIPTISVGAYEPNAEVLRTALGLPSPGKDAKDVDRLPTGVRGHG